MRFSMILILMCVVFPSSAGAVTLVNPDGSVAQPYQEWSDLSRVPTVDTTVVVSTDMTACRAAFPDAMACTNQRNFQMSVSGVPCGYGSDADGLRVCRFFVMHELGHSFDIKMPEWKRLRFSAILGGAAFWTLPSSQGEVFADMYAMCAMGSRRPAFPFDFADVSRRQYRRICHLIRIPNERVSP